MALRRVPGRGSREAEGCGTGQKPRVLPSAPVLSRRHDLHAGRREGRHAACSDARGAGAASSAPPELEPLGDVPPDSRAAGEYYRAILSGHDCVALLRLCKTLHAKQNSQTASRRGVNSTELRSWRMAEEMLYGEFGFALGMPPAAGAGLPARKAGRIRLSAVRGALRYTQVLCRSSRRAGLRRPASAHAYAAQSPRDPYD